jgi:outer membrane receptor for ferric coprogen and ferric-rhodotorulic acid
VRSEGGYLQVSGSQGTYALLGLTAGYKLNDKLQLRVNVDKLLDRRYYQALGYSWPGGLERYGAPRNIFLSLNYKKKN